MRALNSRQVGLLSFRAWCWLLVLTAMPQTFGDFVGVQSQIRTELTICQNTSQDYIDEPLIVCNFFAVVDAPTDRRVYASDADINQDGSIQKGETS